MLVLTPAGLYCPMGNFYIDPSRRVEHAVITHAHADHARRGSEQYYCVPSGEGLLRERVGKKIKVQTHAFGERFTLGGIGGLGGVTVSFHPAGHILGSSQVRIQHGNTVWVASGDYKREPDPTCEPFEPVPCDVFVTEATFGTPSYVWTEGADLGREIWEWWQNNAAQGRNSVLLAYSLGKAQRVLGVLKPYANQPIFCHPAATPLNACYRAQGIALADTRCLSTVAEGERAQGALFLVPHAFLDSPASAVLGDKYQTAFASGWMAGGASGYGRHGGLDHGFVMSDHADWNALLKTIQETGAKRVYVQHRGRGALVRHLRKLGIDAHPESELVDQNPGQLVLF